MAQTPDFDSNDPSAERANADDQRALGNQPYIPRSPSRAIQPEQAPAPPGRSRHARHPVVLVINFLLTIAVLGALAAGGALYWGKQQFEQAGPLSSEEVFIIPSGSRLPDIATRLEQDNIISSALVFEAAVRLYKNQSKMKAGEYAFAPGVTMRQVMSDLVQGKAIFHTITFPEGWTSEQILARLNANATLLGEISDIPAEGTLLPDTYTFTRGTTRQKIIDQMTSAMEQHLAKVWELRIQDLPVNSPVELLILASIVEKETGKADERSRVAGVFVNRLRIGMPLQSDPTILYGLYGGSSWTKDRSAIKKSELKAKNPYNTYQIKGLPPGPIANPGRAALEAVANPSRTKDLFFVADGTGGHAFAETYKQHQRNVAKWRKVERESRKQRANDAKTAN